MTYKFEKIQPAQMYENHLKLGGKNKNGDEIKLNSKYIIRNGRPYIPVMGEIHFSRLSRDMWKDELLKMKAGGITLISTYVFWIYHEEIEGEYNFSGDNDVRTFIELCGECGLEAVLRIGPWAHGECRNGGFPDWLVKKPFPLRENNAQYLALAEKWYTAVYNQVKGLFFKDNGNIIAIQLENELTDQAEHLLKLKEIAKKVGFDVPLYTVTGWNSVLGAAIPKYDVLPVFGGYPEAPWEDHTERLAPSSNYFFHHTRNDSAIGADVIANDSSGENREEMRYDLYPFATCELGGGIQVTHHRRPIIAPKDIYAISLIRLGCGNNLPGYYMYHGGTNKIGKNSAFNESKATGYPNDYPILSYDFQAAIGEFGIIRGHYRLLKDLHLFINDYMEQLAPMNAYMADIPQIKWEDKESLRYSMRERNGSGFVFVSNYQRLDTLKEHTDVVFDTGSIVFPAITVKSGAVFFMPFNMQLDGATLDYATAQPLCRDGNTYFFKKIDGIRPEYSINGKVYCGDNIEPTDSCSLRIVTIDNKWELFKIDGIIYRANSDIYVKDGQVIPYGFDKTASFGIWEEDHFTDCITAKQPQNHSVTFTETEPDYASPYFFELQIDSRRKVRAWNIETDAVNEFLEIGFIGDVIQLYSDGKLKADEYYYNGKWIVPAKLLKNGKGTVVISELKNDVYLETEIKEGLELINIKIRTDL